MHWGNAHPPALPHRHVIGNRAAIAGKYLVTRAADRRDELRVAGGHARVRAARETARARVRKRCAAGGIDWYGVQSEGIRPPRIVGSRVVDGDDRSARIGKAVEAQRDSGDPAAAIYGMVFPNDRKPRDDVAILTIRTQVTR